MDELSLSLGAEIEMPLVWCPPGDFLMGSDDAAGGPLSWPRHKVRLTRGFWIARTPVTQRQWMVAAGAAMPLFDSSAAGAQMPAEGMDWDTARLWCRTLTTRLRKLGALDTSQTLDLPTEAQWEFACRAGTSSIWYFGDHAAELADHGWYAANSGGGKHPVGLKRPNPWGIYDLYGNVAEWCLDDLYKYRADDESNPCRFDETGLVKVTRGGDFSCPAGECQSASRGSSNRDNPFRESTGLRIVCHEGESIWTK